jgi:hypothetical protein
VARLVRLTASLRQDPAWLLTIVTSEAKAQAFRSRLTRALAVVGYPEAVALRTADCVLPAPALFGASGRSECGEAPMPRSPAGLERLTEAATRLAPDLGLAKRPEDARDLIAEAMRRHLAGAGLSTNGDGGWLRRGVGLVEESVRVAQVEALRRLRMMEGSSGWPRDLGRQLRRPGDVTLRARELRSALERALRSQAIDRVEVERLRGLVDIAAIDLVEAARREAVAAVARRRLWEAAGALLGEIDVPARDPGKSSSENGRVTVATARHIVVDDAHDLAGGDLECLRAVPEHASLFVTGDQRAAGLAGGGRGEAAFRALLGQAGRAVVLLEAPRFGAGLGRFVNALGARLWPASEPGGYAPAIARLDADPSAATAVELWLVRRRTDARADGEHPEPIEEARRREARAVAAGVRRMLNGGRAADAAVLVRDDRARDVVAEALAAAGVAADAAVIRTVGESHGLEWPTVFVTGLDEAVGGPAPRRAWMDEESGLPVVWPRDENGHRIWPFSSLLLARRAAEARDASARTRLFLAAARARTHLILSGVTRARVAGGDSCAAPI